MKRLSQTLNENLEFGNSLNKGVTNHYTPIDNIVINVRNFFGSWLGLLVMKGEDGFSLKITSNAFTSPEAIRQIIYSSTFDGHTYLGDYISLQGLRELKIIEVGPMNYVAYFCPTDISAAKVDGKCVDSWNNEIGKIPCKEMKEHLVEESEMFTVLKEEFEETELHDTSREEVVEIINGTNKIEAAKKLDEFFQKTIKLPENMYVKATKDGDGHESVAIRLKYEKRRPFGGKIESTVSLLNIYNAGVNAVWVSAFDTVSEIHWDVNDDIKNLLTAVLELIGAEATEDPCVFNIPDSKNTVSTEDDPNLAKVTNDEVTNNQPEETNEQ